MDEFSPSLMKLWKEWNVRTTVLLSFMLQIVLMVLGNCRKHDSRLWVRIVTWCAYSAADLVATYALGIITNNISHLHKKNCGYTGANTELTAFWAPFLLMHLGGPDTITAYSLEDNELWSRHLLGLVGQMVAAIYVGVMAWTGSLISFLSLSMLFAGLIKYGERTWVLRKASLDKIRESYSHPSKFQVFSTILVLKESGVHNLVKAYYLMDIIFQPLFLDLSLLDILDESGKSFLLSSVEDAFQIIGMSLTFMYNNLYTKALLLYTYVGVGLRVITVILTTSVSVLFLVLVHKHKFSKIDVTITFILLFGAIILEIYSALSLLFSDRCQVWLKEHHDLMFEAFQGVLPKKDRWSNKMSQLSLVSFIMKEKPMPCSNFLKHFSIVEKLENQWYAADIEIPNDLKKLIFDYLKAKRERTPSEFSSDIEIPSESTRIDLPRIDVDAVDFTQQLEQSIIAWHVATEICYEIDGEHVNGDPVIESICQISRYMFSLLVLHPNVLLNVETTLFALQPILVAARGSRKFTSKFEACRNISKLLERTTSIIMQKLDKTSPKLEEDKISTYVFFSSELPDFLGQLEIQESWEERWRKISYTWLEMLSYAAYKCRGMQHAQRLRRGGEFLTHVWLFTKSLGFTEKDFKFYPPTWANSFVRFSGASSSS